MAMMTRDEAAARLDPELSAFLDRPHFDLRVVPLAEARANAEASFRLLGPEDAPAPEVVLAPGLPGAPTVQLRIHRPQGAPARLALLHIHGGGMVMGSAASLDRFIASRAEKWGVVVASVEYRLAPEHPHPAPLHDCVAGLEWLLAHCGDFGLAPAQVVVMGESAGGGLAAATCLHQRDHGRPQAAGQILVYPMLDHRTGQGWEDGDTRLGWNAASNGVGWGALKGPGPLPDGAGLSHFSPARADDLSGLPPAWIAVGTLDLFLDENADYARRIARAGGEVRLITYPGAPHGFQVVPSAVTARYNRDLAAAIARFCG